jgi:hypothetical protein
MLNLQSTKAYCDIIKIRNQKGTYEIIKKNNKHEYIGVRRRSTT